MKNIFGKAIAVVLAGMSLASCDLNLLPEATIVYDEEKGFFTIKDDLIGAEQTLYSNFRATTGGFYNFLEDLMFDGFNASLDYGNNYGSIHRTDASFTASDQDIESFWGNYYITIKNYNVTIDAAEVAPEDLYEDARVIKGEACAARAYAYLQLARHFAPAYDPATADTDLSVPLVLHYNQNAKATRATNKEVYEQILVDLDSAAVILTAYEGKVMFKSKDKAAPEHTIGNVANSAYFTLDAVKAMQARALLDMGEYKAAADSAVAVINSAAGYALAADASELEKVRTEDAGTEAIMSLYASKTEGAKSYSIFTSYGDDANSPTKFSYNKPYFLPSKTLMDMYETNDYRKLAWFFQTTADPLNNSGNYYNNVFLFGKYAGNLTLSSKNYATATVASKPFMISEMYLIAAEGYFQAGDNANGKKYLNQLQNKRKTTLTALNMDYIQKEWIRETICEGLRLSCMKRWGAGFSGRAPQANTAELIMTSPVDAFEEKVMASDDRALVWPIPSYEIKINPALEQNKGYGNE